MNHIITAEHISKLYRIGVQRRKDATMTGRIIQTLKRPLENFRRIRNLSSFQHDDESIFKALDDINFSVEQGEVLGIIGHNGAGKSTLLKILSRITEPTSGRIVMNGRVSALLEVGTGFHPELTGRDNIFMNGTILGMTRKEIAGKLDEIVAFSGIEKHLDTPVKFYSSGMKVRLGFAVAAHLEPEILVVDEVLAVGDVEFQKKCLGKMQHVARDEGRTILFVSHHMPSVKNLCSRCITLNHGRIAFNGNVSEAIDHYLSNGLNMSETGLIPDDMRRDYGGVVARFNSVKLENAAGVAHKEFYYGEPITIETQLTVIEPIPDYVVSVIIGTLDGQYIVYSEHPGNSSTHSDSLEPGKFKFRFDLNTSLLPGSYSVYLSLSRSNGTTLDWVERVHDFQVNRTGFVKGDQYKWEESHGYVRNISDWQKENI